MVSVGRWLGCLAVLAGLAGCGGSGPAVGTDTGSGDSAFGRVTADETVTASTGAITGQVTGADGQPVAGAVVTVSTPGTGRDVALGTFSTVTDGSGNYAIGNLTPGAYDLQVTGDGLVATIVKALVQAGARFRGGVQVAANDVNGDGVADLVTGDGVGIPSLAGVGGSIVGTVVRATGRPIAGAKLSVGRRLTVSNAAGRFALGPLLEGIYAVTCTAPGFQTVTQQAVVQFGVSTTLAFSLSPGMPTQSDQRTATVRGVVVDAATRQPVPGVKVGIGGQQTPIQTTLTDARGAFLFAGLQPGVLVLGARTPGYRTFLRPVDARAGRTVEVPVNLATQSAAASTGTLQVTVLSSDGQPIRFAVLVLDDQGPFLTSAGGTLTITHVPVGQHNLFGKARLHNWAQGPLTISGDQTTQVTLTLAPLGADQGTNVNLNGAGPGGAVPGRPTRGQSGWQHRRWRRRVRGIVRPA